jgi:two-component system chemotaxis response regulator CheV
MALDHNILLEVGTNELEIVEFSLKNDTKDYMFGINVAKVKEVLKITSKDITPLPESKNIEGIIRIRDTVIPVINLKKVFGIHSTSQETNKLYLLYCYFNTISVGFIIDNIIGIKKVNWNHIETGGNIVAEHDNKLVGIIKLPDKLIQLLDYEQIVSDIAPEIVQKKLETVYTLSPNNIKELTNKKILFAEDSSLIRNLLSSFCSKYNLNATIVNNGKELISAYNTIKPDIIITDIEMPLVDGLTAIKIIREKEKEATHKAIIIVFSSMYSVENERKAKTVGINAFVPKPDLKKLIDTIKELINK